MSNFMNALKTSFTRNVFFQQTRNIFILKRRHPPPLSKLKAGKPKRLNQKYFIYDLVQDTNIVPSKPINVILTKYAEKIGDIGDIVSLKPYYAYKHFLLPGFAVYDTPENREKYKLVDETRKTKFSSPNVGQITRTLSKMIIYINMHPKNPWVVEPWHVKLAFMRYSMIVPEYAIELPENEIKGPDMSLEKKEFYVVITINKTEKVNVRCRIHHCDFDKTTNPIPNEPWTISLEPLFPEQAEVLNSMSLGKK